jgi:hypothetical protein
MIKLNKKIRYIRYIIIFIAIFSLGSIVQRFHIAYIPENQGFHFSRTYVLLDQQYQAGRELQFSDFVLYKDNLEIEIGMIIQKDTEKNTYLIQPPFSSQSATWHTSDKIQSRILMVLFRSK